MKKVTITIDGREIEAEITDEQAKELLNKRTGLERTPENEFYWYSGPDGKTHAEPENNALSDDESYDTANYYADQHLAEDDARFYQLHRQLKRFSVLNREHKPDWDNRDDGKWSISCSHTGKQCGLFVEKSELVQRFGLPYFDSFETAQKAVIEFESELTWYFARYCDSL